MEENNLKMEEPQKNTDEENIISKQINKPNDLDIFNFEEKIKNKFFNKEKKENNFEHLKKLVKETIKDEKFKKSVIIQLDKENNILVNDNILQLINPPSKEDKKILLSKWKNLSISTIEKKTLLQNVTLTAVKFLNSASFYTNIIQKLCILYDKENMEELKEKTDDIQNVINNKLENYYMNILIHADYKEDVNIQNYTSLFNLLHRYVNWVTGLQKMNVIDMITDVVNLEFVKPFRHADVITNAN